MSSTLAPVGLNTDPKPSLRLLRPLSTRVLPSSLSFLSCLSAPTMNLTPPTIVFNDPDTISSVPVIIFSIGVITINTGFITLTITSNAGASIGVNASSNGLRASNNISMIGPIDSKIGCNTLTNDIAILDTVSITFVSDLLIVLIIGVITFLIVLNALLSGLTALLNAFSTRVIIALTPLNPAIAESIILPKPAKIFVIPPSIFPMLNSELTLPLPPAAAAPSSPATASDAVSGLALLLLPDFLPFFPDIFSDIPMIESRMTVKIDSFLPEIISLISFVATSDILSGVLSLAAFFFSSSLLNTDIKPLPNSEEFIKSLNLSTTLSVAFSAPSSLFGLSCSALSLSAKIFLNVSDIPVVIGLMRLSFNALTAVLPAPNTVLAGLVMNVCTSPSVLIPFSSVDPNKDSLTADPPLSTSEAPLLKSLSIGANIFVANVFNPLKPSLSIALIGVSILWNAKVTPARILPIIPLFCPEPSSAFLLLTRLSIGMILWLSLFLVLAS